jgi:hypothetical protein
MGYRIGSGYFGSDSLKTSTANVELIQANKPVNWANVEFKTYKFSFLNKSACTIKLNGGSPIYLDAFQGFNMTEIDAPLTTFHIVEKDIPYTYLGAF